MKHPKFKPGEVHREGGFTKEARKVKSIAQRLLERPGYVRTLQTKLDNGTLHPSIQCLLWYYAHGKPVDTSGAEGKPVQVKIVNEFTE